MPEKLETYKFMVEESGRKMQVIIPKSNDKSYDNYLIEAETEKTKDELRKQGVKPQPKEGSRETLVADIKDLQAFRQRKAEGRRKYY